jgi:hypothetical protein
MARRVLFGPGSAAFAQQRLQQHWPGPNCQLFDFAPGADVQLTHDDTFTEWALTGGSGKCRSLRTTTRRKIATRIRVPARPERQGLGGGIPDAQRQSPLLVLHAARAVFL